MVLGYDEPRPSRKDYDSFLEKFVSELNKLGNSGISLMIYGSYTRKDFMPGRSDIDAVLIFPGDVVTDKKNAAKISAAMSSAQEKNNIPFQVSLADLRTMSDGRFNSYDPNFETYFKEEGNVLIGPDYRGKFKFELANQSDQTAIRFNLRRARIGLISLEQLAREDYLKLLREFNQTLNSVSRGSKQILGLMDGNLRLNRFSALNEIPEIFPQVNVEPLEEIKHLYANLGELDKIYRNPGEISRIFDSSVTFFEEIIKAYLDANPRNN